MSRLCHADDKWNTSPFVGLAKSGTRACFLLVQFLLVVANASGATTNVRVAVAPFAGDADGALIAKALAEALSARDIERLIAPGEFVAKSQFDPRAADIRRWAYNSAVETIIVGRVQALRSDGRITRVVETVLRSGHSGAELSRHEVVLGKRDEVKELVAGLADSILASLGFPQQKATADIADNSTTAQPQGEPPTPQPPAAGRPGGDGLGLNLSRSGFRSDAPIEIKADEAEIINRNEGRRLIFHRNVVVKQANVSLRSNRLEAFYESGESEPRELRAEGQVAIEQGERRAKCDRAIYRREADRLTCVGHAELIQGCDVVRGESIEFDLGGNQARVEGAASIVIQPKPDESDGESPVANGCNIIRGSL